MTKYITIALGIILACLAFLPYDEWEVNKFKLRILGVEHE